MTRLVLLALPMCVAAGCGRDTIDYEAPAKSFANLPPIFSGIRSASEVVLYEGLPHGHWERESLAKELASKATVTMHKFPYYQERIKPNEADSQALRDLVCTRDSFRAFGGYKASGGFQPDYCIEWRAGGAVYRMLICFGCGEARLLGPRHETCCDIDKSAAERLATMLEPYRKNRPVREIK